MLKIVAAGVIIAAIACSSLVLAQRGPIIDIERRPSPEAASIMADARVGAVKGVLKLTPAQEPLWPPVEAALGDLLRMRAERKASGQRDFAHDPIQQFKHRADVITTMGASLRKLANAAEPLFQSLDDGQRQRLRFLVQTMRARQAARLENLHDFRPAPWRHLNSADSLFDR